MPVSRRHILKLVGVSTVGAAVPDLFIAGPAHAANPISIGNNRVQLTWADPGSGWAMQSVKVINGATWLTLPNPVGGYGILYADTAPSSTAVADGTAGTFLAFTPTGAVTTGSGLRFTATTARGTLTADWSMDPVNTADVLVSMTFTPSVAGWYSLATPTLVSVDTANLERGVVPGYWDATVTQPSYSLAHNYGLGIPTTGMVARERSAPSPLSMLHTTGGVSIAVIPAPGTGRDPWPASTGNQSAWQLGLSSMDRQGRYSPTAYHPVLGQPGSQAAAGQAISFSFRYTLVASDWYNVFRHLVSGVYPIASYLNLAQNQRSLVARLAAMQEFLMTPSSQWHTWTYNGLTLGAESSKLSDVGAMWMLARITGDPILINERLPYARNFKLAQQQTTAGTFHGAALGEYYRDGDWVSENFLSGAGPNYVSPMFTTFYTLADMGNILLFDPSDTVLRDRLRLAADKLLSWQHPDGSFDIGYLRNTPTTLIYPALLDYRATWYGLLVAYRVLGDAKYLTGARAGADWFVANAVRPGRYLGVCDDTKLPCDFHAAFAAQALLDLATITGATTYSDAAVEVGRHYSTHIFTHPVATADPRTFEHRSVQEWQISQVGLPFEHAGYIGSVNGAGPILLTSHVGAFIRLYQKTGDSVYRDLARAAVRGRDAFIGPTSSIPSYYWSAGSTGSGVYPWQGWWHAGWMVDYLMAEADLRSSGAVSFPRGFLTAKVGASGPYGHVPGTIFGQSADLWQPPGLVTTGSPDLESLTARSADGSRLFVVLLNTGGQPVSRTVTLDRRALVAGRLATWNAWHALAGSVSSPSTGQYAVTVAGNGMVAFSVDLTLAADPAGPRLRTRNVTSNVTSPTMAWSYWTTTTSWAQWRVLGSSTWNSTAEQHGYTFTATLDLSAVDTPATVEIRLATRDTTGNIGYSDPVPYDIYGVGTNLALTATATASSTYTSVSTAAKAIDGNRTDTASRWLSATTGTQPWLAVRLAAAASVKLVRVYSGPDAGQVLVDFKVQKGDGIGGWTTVGTVTGNTTSQTDVLVNSVTTRDLRLLVTAPSRDAINVARVFELEVYDELR